MKLLRGICLGSTGSGKTSILSHMQHKRIVNPPPTAGVDYAIFEHNNIRFQCWDASGDHKYIDVAKMFASDCAVVLLVFDITSQTSLDEATQWIENTYNDSQMRFLIGNKAEKSERAPGISAVRQQYPDMAYYEISAKQLPDLEHMFDSILVAAEHLTRDTMLCTRTVTQDRTTSTVGTSSRTQECCTVC